MAKAITNEEFQRRFKETYGDEYTLLDDYKNSTTKLRVKHNCDYCGGEVREMLSKEVMNKLKCLVCFGDRDNKKTFEKKLDKINKDIKLIGDFKDKQHKVMVKHKCGYRWEVIPSSLLISKTGCPKCAGNIKKTTEEFEQEVLKKYDDKYTVLGEYVNANTKILIRHNLCNKVFDMLPSNLLCGQECPYCKIDRLRKKLSKAPKQFKNEVKNLYGNEYKVLGQYINSKTRILVQHNCNKCNNSTFLIRPSDLINGQKCPVCSHRKVAKGINDIATTHPYLVQYFANIEDAYKYSYGSNKKAILKCPLCGKKSKKAICDLTRNGKVANCSNCGDGISYPEKFIIKVLDQLNIKYKTQYSPDWIKPKRYDFYIPSLNCIIETHGEQHYSRKSNFRSLGGRTLQEEQTNDQYKRKIALAKGIERYIELDCRKSNLEWIKNSILNSKLTELFDLSKVDWLKCAEFANKNIVKEVCEDYNIIKDVKLISKKYNINRNTIVKYLRLGTKIGLCVYDKNISELIRINKSTKANRRAIINIESQKVFEGCNIAAKQLIDILDIKIQPSCISLVARGKQSQTKGLHFKYVEDLTEEEKEKYNIPQKLKQNGGGNNE